MTFLFDAHFSPKLCDALAALAIEAHHVRRELGDAARDTEWIALAGRHGWIIVTCDFRLRARKAERQALRRAGVSVLFVPQRTVFRSDARLQMAWFCQNHATISRKIGQAPWGTHFEYKGGGAIKPMPGLP